MILTAGIDAGATHTKVVITGPDGQMAGKAVVPSGYNFARAAERGLQAALEDARFARDRVAYIAATGFGRHMVPFRDVAITEITCHAWAMHGFFPEVRTILDIGGQTVKAIRLDERGRVKAFRLNDKCAAGSGAFLEKTMRYMGYEAQDIAALAAAATDPAVVSSICAVFAESEVINHLVAGRSASDVCAGAVTALAERAAQLVKRLRSEPRHALSGGLARVPSMRRALEGSLNVKFLIAPDDLGVYAGALGAARLAHERMRRLDGARQASLH
jgi:predicted CoA-substrate-specific enzyme activase